jgi:hypothetical protein
MTVGGGLEIYRGDFGDYQCGNWDVSVVDSFGGAVETGCTPF